MWRAGVVVWLVNLGQLATSKHGDESLRSKSGWRHSKETHETKIRPGLFELRRCVCGRGSCLPLVRYGIKIYTIPTGNKVPNPANPLRHAYLSLPASFYLLSYHKCSCRELETRAWAHFQGIETAQRQDLIPWRWTSIVKEARCPHRVVSSSCLPQLV